MASVVHTSTSSFYAGVGQQCKQYDRYFAESAARHSLDPMLLAAVAMQESSCNAEAASSTGIPGLMQVACVNFPGGRCSDDVSVSLSRLFWLGAWRRRVCAWLRGDADECVRTGRC